MVSRLSPANWVHVTNWLHERFLAAKVPKASGASWKPGEPIVVAGMFNTASGIGESARSSYYAMHDQGLNPTAVDISALFGPVDFKTSVPFGEMPRDERGLLVLHMNAPETVRALHYLNPVRFRGWRVVGAWAWELEHLPAYWSNGFRYVDEIWALSAFTAGAITRAGSVPTRVVAPVVHVPGSVSPRRDEFGIDPDVFTVLALTDVLSSPLRKNPLGAVKAFRAAFSDDPKAQMIVKLRNLDRNPKFQHELSEAVAGAGNIRVMENVLSREEILSLIMSADALISLHRSEGFCLPLAEAMSLGVPTVATGWSGNMDFMDESTAMLVPFELTPVSGTDPFYGTVPGAVWAEPSIEGAADALRCLKQSPSLRQTISSRAREVAAKQSDTRRFVEAAGLLSSK